MTPQEQLDAHRRAWVPFKASQAAQGCGRLQEHGPLTEMQALYEAEYEVWQRDHQTPWLVRREELKAELNPLTLFDAA